jgi:hypothetical protein
MQIKVIEKECVAKTGIQVEFSNSECRAIERVKDQVSSAIASLKCNMQCVIEKQGKFPKEAIEKMTISIDLNTAMRIEWLLDNFVHKSESNLFGLPDGKYKEFAIAVTQTEV